MLLQLSSLFPLCPPPSTTLYSLRKSPYHCSCPWVIYIYSLATPFPILYFTFPWLFCSYQFVLLNPFITSPVPLQPLPTGNYQNSLCIHDSVSALFVCLIFLDSIVDRYVFIASLLFIVFIFFF